MNFAARTRYLLVTLAIIVASVIQLARGYKPVIVLSGAATFLLLGNLAVYLSGAKQRAMRRQQQREYWSR